MCPRREKGYKERSLCVFVPACRLTCTNGAHSSISVHAGMRGCEGESIRGQKTREHKGSTGSSERETRDRKKALTLFVSLHWLPPVSAPTQQGSIDYKDACDRLCVYEGVFGWISVLKTHLFIYYIWVFIQARLTHKPFSKRMFKYMLRTGKGGDLVLSWCMVVLMCRTIICL